MTETLRSVRLTAAESFWYVLGCIGFGAMYFAKVPAKKALSEAGLAEMTSAEHFWYVLQCIAFGGGYFAKIPIKKALSEMAQAPAAGYAPGVGYAPPQLDPGYGPQTWNGGQSAPTQAPPGQHQAWHDARGQ